MFARRVIVAVILVCGIYSFPLKAEFQFSPWNGLYNTGGYNLLTFGSDLYDLSNYFNNYYWVTDLSPYTSWGGNCGSFFSSCYSPYDPSLYSYYNYNGWLDSNINIDINLTLTPFLYSGYNSCGYGGYYDWCSYGCGYNQYCNLFPYNYYSAFNNYNNYSCLWPYNYNNYGWFDWNSISIPINIGVNYPINVPVWGGCDNIIVPCTGSAYPYYNTPIVQQYSPNYNYVPTEPIRYQIPRGAMTH